MKHGVTGRKFGRVRNQRTALLRSLARSLVLHGGIETTEAKAKELRPFIEKLVTRAKEDTIANRRVLSSRLGNDKKVVEKLVKEIAPAHKDRAGGYTRIVKLPKKLEDGRKVAYISFV